MIAEFYRFIQDVVCCFFVAHVETGSIWNLSLWLVV